MNAPLASRSPLRRLMFWTVGIIVGLAVLAVAGIWVAGRSLPAAMGLALSERTGATLVCENNQTNLFLGRVDLQQLVLNYQDSDVLKIRRILVDLDTSSFLNSGERVIEEVELDLDHVRLVGGANPLRDNNLTAMIQAWQASAGPTDPASQVAAPTGPAPRFLIRKLRLRVGGFTLVQAMPGAPERVLSRDERGLEFVATDVTNDNLSQTLMAPLAAAALTRATANPETLLEGALRRQRK